MEARESYRFLNRLYNPGDTFEVLYRHEDGTVARQEREMADGPAATSDLLDEFARAEDGGYNVYSSAMPLHVQASGTFDRIWVDQDEVTAPWPFGADPNFDGAQWPAPTTLVKTSEAEGGFRWQAIWLISEDIEPAKARIVMKQLAKRIDADGSVHDSRRVLRVPGIMNAKRGSAARLIDTSEGDVSLDAFYLPEDTPMQALLNVEVQNPMHVLGEWLAGAPEGDRNRKAYVAARFLKGCEVDYTDAGAILQLGAQRCDPPLDSTEVQHALDSAYHRSST
jgi:hypothetical protein